MDKIVCTCNSLMTFRLGCAHGVRQSIRHGSAGPPRKQQHSRCFLRRQNQSDFLKYGIHGDAKSDARASAAPALDPFQDMTNGNSTPLSLARSLPWDAACIRLARTKSSKKSFNSVHGRDLLSTSGGKCVRLIKDLKNLHAIDMIFELFKIHTRI